MLAPDSVGRTFAGADAIAISQSEIDAFAAVIGETDTSIAPPTFTIRISLDQFQSNQDFIKIMPINIHYSLLPKYRGASPIQSSLLNGDCISGITFMKMSEELDDGDCIKQYELNIKNNHNKITLEKDLCDLSITKIFEILDMVKEEKYTLIEQDNNSATYCKKINKSEAMISFNETADEIYNKFKAYYEWPGICFEHKNITVKIKEMSVIDDIEGDLNDKNIMINKNALYIRTSNKTIVITYLQMPNKNIISSSDAFNAYKDYFNE